MQTKIHSDFWSDPDIEAQPGEVKYAALWLMTNERVNLLGCAEVTGKKFAYDTGLPVEALRRAIEALPKTFVALGKGFNNYWIRNYIRRQFGEGDSLLRNNLFKPLARAWQGLRDPVLKEQILKEYPEFECCLPAPVEGSPYQGLQDFPKDKEKEKEQEQEKAKAQDGGGAGEETQPLTAIPRGIEEVLAYFLDQGSTEIEARKFHDHFTANGWRQGGRAKIKDWRAAARNWIRRSDDGTAPGKIKSGGPGPSVPFNPRQANAHTGGMAEVTG
jgi:hypothetical protein